MVFPTKRFFFFLNAKILMVANLKMSQFLGQLHKFCSLLDSIISSYKTFRVNVRLHPQYRTPCVPHNMPSNHIVKHVQVSVRYFFYSAIEIILCLYKHMMISLSEKICQKKNVLIF